MSKQTTPLPFLLLFTTFIFAVGALSSPLMIQAATFDIAPGDVYGPEGLVAAINTANANSEADIINLAANSDYVLDHLYNPWDSGDPYQSYPSGSPVIRSDLTINGNNSTLRRDEQSVDYFRVLTTRGGVVTINDLTISGGNIPAPALYGYMGGGILAGQGTTKLTLNNSTVTNNHATHGSGIATLWTNLDINNSHITDNTATLSLGSNYTYGGGLWLGSYTSSNLLVNITDSVITNNTAIYGGGIYSNVSHLSLNNTVVSFNTGTWGGGMYTGSFYNEGSFDIVDSQFVDNGAYQGGGIYGANIISGSVSSTRFERNYGWSILSVFVGSQLNYPGVLTLHNNCFNTVGEGAVYSWSPQVSIDATQNWWGAADGPSWQAPGSGSMIGNQAGSLPVVYEPFLTTGCPLDHVNQAPTVSTTGSIQVNEGSSVTLTALGTDPENDTLTYAWDLDNNGSYETLGQDVDFSAANLDGPSSYTVGVQVMDTGGLSATAQAVVEVVNVAPTLGAIAGPSAPILISGTVNLSAAFSDPGVLDSHTASWSWGDGTSSVATISEATGSGTASGSHVYTSTGVYVATLNLQDDDGGLAPLASFQYIVIYDNNAQAAFATGAGQFSSNAGSYPTNPGLAGNAKFGFNVKYAPGASIPTGKTSLRLQNLNFTSSGYDWMVVTGDLVKFQGAGSFAGDPTVYTFQVTTVDTSSDLFRIRITNGASVIYDNEISTQPDAVPTTVINGSIIIHH